MTDHNGGEPTNPQIIVEFMPDGNARLHTTPGVGAQQMWVASRLMELMGDSQFAEAQLLEQSKRGKIAIPGMSGLRGLKGGKS
jgi:hypothetical protein